MSSSGDIGQTISLCGLLKSTGEENSDEGLGLQTWDASSANIESLEEPVNDPYAGNWDDVWIPPVITAQDRRDIGNQTGRVHDPWQVPFGVRHYFLEYVRVMLEGSFQRYVRKHLLERMHSESLLFWIRNTRNEHDRNMLDSRDWREPVDLSNSVLLLKFAALPSESLRIGHEPLDRVLNSVDALRQDTVHRHAEVSVSNMLLALSLPTVLKDDDCATKLEAMWDHISGSRSDRDSQDLEQEVMAAFELAGFPVETLQMTGHQLLYRIQSLLEVTLFCFARSAHPDLLDKHGWTRPEQVELGQWLHHWQSSPTTSVNWNDLQGMLHNVRKMRNCWAHRNLVDEYDMLPWIHNAIRLAILLDNFRQAVEIEILAEQWFERTCRCDVLDRLHGVYMQDKPTTTLNQKDITKRQAAITAVLADALLPTRPDADTLSHLRYPETSVYNASGTASDGSTISESPISTPLLNSESMISEVTTNLNPMDNESFHHSVEDGAPTPQQDAQVSEWPLSMHATLKTV
ncbi:MAG: hypothetical protein Q9217_000946 [Psora testacea]